MTGVRGRELYYLRKKIVVFPAGAHGNDLLGIIALLIVTYLIAVVVTVRKYKKLMSSCDSLIDSLEKV